MSQADDPARPAPKEGRRVAPVKGAKADPAREARLKSALKANIARRKAQARARGDEEQPDD